jgi:hypothetical protein
VTVKRLAWAFTGSDKVRRILQVCIADAQVHAPSERRTRATGVAADPRCMRREIEWLMPMQAPRMLHGHAGAGGIISAARGQ